MAVTPTPTTVPGLLRAARVELDRRGWTQHDYEADTGEVCLIGALNAAVAGDPIEEPSTPDGWRLLGGALDALVQHIAPVRADEEFEYPEDLGYYLADHVSTWNDTPGRTLDDVRALLTGTAAALDTVPARYHAASERDVADQAAVVYGGIVE
jgi:hypothetical protein